MKIPNSQYEAMKQAEQAGMLPGQARMLNEDELRLREGLFAQARGMQNIAPGSPLYDKVIGTNHHEEWVKAYAEARASHAAGEPLIRTVCKIADRILLILLLVGVVVAVMV